MLKIEKLEYNDTPRLIRIIFRGNEVLNLICVVSCVIQGRSRIILQHRSTDLALKWPVSNKITCVYTIY